VLLGLRPMLEESYPAHTFLVAQLEASVTRLVRRVAFLAGRAMERRYAKPTGCR
jgi:hypothetical protein